LKIAIGSFVILPNFLHFRNPIPDLFLGKAKVGASNFQKSSCAEFKKW